MYFIFKCCQNHSFLFKAVAFLSKYVGFLLKHNILPSIMLVMNWYILRDNSLFSLIYLINIVKFSNDHSIIVNYNINIDYR